MDDKALGAQIREAREAMRLSQEDLGRLVGKDQRAISEYENGKRRVAAVDIPGFADVLNVSVAYFFQDENVDPHLDELLLIEFHSLPSSQEQRDVIEVIRIFAKSINR